ncbi:MAG: hypothetical protein HKN20_07335 [Gemmatimonadetes bacterium]|nr:hypothetical protein [Gemmatimonadota bacterium]
MKRNNRTLAGALLLFLLAFSPVAGALANEGGRLPDYHTGSDQVPQTPSVTGGAVGAFANPASWATTARGEAAFWWNDGSVRKGNLDNYGFSLGRGLGFAMQRNQMGGPVDNFAVFDYQLGFASGNRAGHFGIAYQWSGGDDERIGREKVVKAGSISRPNRYLSYGMAGHFSTESPERLGVFDFGVRPILGKPLLTLFSDYSVRNGEKIDEGRWGAGFEVRPYRGIHVGMKFRDATGADEYAYSLNLGVTLGGSGFHVLPSYDEEGERRNASGLRPTTYLVRMDPPYQGLPLANLIRKAVDGNRYVEMDLRDRALVYQTAQWFDDDRIAWLDLARDLEHIRDDVAVRGVAINLAGFRGSPVMLWEFREKLRELQRAGKEVIVHMERGEMPLYYLASVADDISIDPQGDLLLPGLALQRTYMKSALDKLGLGFREFRYFQYKTAVNTLVRDEMSEGDKEQLGRIVDVIYETWRAGICEGRGFENAHFDKMVEDAALVTARDAIRWKLVDRLGRWDELEKWLEEERGGARLGPLPFDRDRLVHPDERWGRPKELAVVYAVGVCDMNSGIRGRDTSKHLRDLADRRDVAAVVLRADSPGGDPLPSDLVVAGLEKNREEGKPVVVTQGNVAASGGYWISMPGDAIFTGPLTITGSIGVISGWLYDNGVGEKTGFRAEGPQRGSHSDLFSGIRFPLVGRIPARDVTPVEEARIKTLILELYGEFVGTVAKNRDLDSAGVHTIAQGRVWMGGDAIDRKLCDRQGSFTDAILDAKRRAGLEPDEEVIFSEFPERQRFRLPRILPDIPGMGMLHAAWNHFRPRSAPALSSAEPDYAMTYLESVLGAHGNPLALMPPEQLLEEWFVTE